METTPSKPPRKWYLRPWFLILALIVGGGGTYVATKKTPWERFLAVAVGDEFSGVTRALGPPEAQHETAHGIDYLFAVTGNPTYPKLFGRSFPAYRIIRVKNGRVISKGSYEDYYDPYKPRWAQKA